MSFVVTIDGPAAAGKSTTARAVARRLGFLYLDTGALYRALALKVHESGVAPHDAAAVERCADQTEIGLVQGADRLRILMDGAEVTDDIRTPEVSELSSLLAAQPAVRRRLLEIQRELAERGPLVAEGRDLGTVVFPDAEVKIYLDADVETRAERRSRELQSQGIPAALDSVREELARRDERDRNRGQSPLAIPADATVIDSTHLDVAGQIEAILKAVRSHPRLAGGDP